MNYLSEIRSCAQACQSWRERGTAHRDAGNHEAAKSCFDLARECAREAFRLVAEQEMVRTFNGLEAA